jgi:hypothetical protein
VGATEANGFPEMGFVEMEERDGGEEENGFHFPKCSLGCKKEKKEELK